MQFLDEDYEQKRSQMLRVWIKITLSCEKKENKKEFMMWKDNFLLLATISEIIQGEKIKFTDRKRC